MNRFARHIVISVILLMFIPTFVCSQINSPSNESATETDQDGTKFGALAIDRGNVYLHGWASECPTLAFVEKKAIEECTKRGGRCTIVLSFSGTGCAAYRYITGNVGMGYGWGLALNKEEADEKAKKECAERSYGLPAPNIKYRCNSKNAGELQVIYDAHDELKLVLPGTITEY